MFKGTTRHPEGEFSDAVAAIGGQENAFTSYDYTAYFQRVAKEHLGEMMHFEADRMTNLSFDESVVGPERDVVIEERRMRTDSDPDQQLSEAMDAALFTHHPYGLPIIGWMHEIEGLNRDDAFNYYQRFYTPSNAILVVAGDVEAEAAQALAQEHYGRIASAPRPQRLRPQEPPPRAARRVTVSDARVEQPLLRRLYLAPSTLTGGHEAACALDVLAEVLGGGATSVLYRKLVLEKAKAVSAGAWYFGSAVDQTRFGMTAAPAQDVSLDDLEKHIDDAVADFIAKGVDEADFRRATTRLVADMVYAQDSQATLARVYGSALAIGESIADVQQWPARIAAVTPEGVMDAARAWLDARTAVTGRLEPQ